MLLSSRRGAAYAIGARFERTTKPVAEMSQPENPTDNAFQRQVFAGGVDCMGPQFDGALVAYQFQLNELLGIVRVILESPFKELASNSLQLASVKELALKLEITTNTNDEQLLKVSLTLDEHTVVGFLR